MIQNMLDTINVDWEALFSNIMSSFVSGAGGVFSSVFNTLINIVSGVVQTFIAFIFAIYIVANKEKLKRQTTHLMEAYMLSLIHIFLTSSMTSSGFICVIHLASA